MMKYVRKMVIHLGHEILKQDIYCQLIIYLFPVKNRLYFLNT